MVTRWKPMESLKNLQALKKCHEALFWGVFSFFIFAAFELSEIFFFGAFHSPRGNFYYPLICSEFIWPLSYMLAFRAIYNGWSGLRRLSEEDRKPVFRKTVFGILLSVLVLTSPHIYLAIRRLPDWQRIIFIFENAMLSWAGPVMVDLGVAGIKRSNDKPWDDFHALDNVILYAYYLLAVAGLVICLAFWCFTHMWDGFTMG
jgi:hypothetical protein